VTHQSINDSVFFSILVNFLLLKDSILMIWEMGYC